MCVEVLQTGKTVPPPPLGDCLSQTAVVLHRILSLYHFNSHVKHVTLLSPLEIQRKPSGNKYGRFRFFYSNSIRQCYQRNSLNKLNLSFHLYFLP